MYFEIDPKIDEKALMMKKETHEFAEKVMRPAAEKLDKMSDPDDTIAKDSPYWDVLKRVKRLGYHRLFLDPQYGGLGLTAVEVNMVLEELGWGSVGLATAIGVDQHAPSLISMLGTEDIIKEIVEPFVNDTEGKYHGCWGVTEPDVGSDYILASEPSFRPHAEGLHLGQVKADKDGDEWIINGPKSSWISSAPAATFAGIHLILPPHDSLANGAYCFVPLDLEGVTKGKPINKLGMRDNPQGELVFDNVRIPNRYMIIGPPFYELRIGQTICLTSCFMAAIFTGLARAAFEEALQYSKDRIQGGKPLCEHQSVKQKLYTMFEKVETSRCYSRKVMEHVWERFYTERTFDASSRHAIAAQVYCTNAAFEVASEALQIHGGYGLTKEFLVEKLFRDARASLIMDGANDVLSLAAAYNIVDSY